VSERVRFKAGRAGWYFVQVKLAAPGFGDYEISLRF
jgi:hypothetical protein